MTDFGPVPDGIQKMLGDDTTKRKHISKKLRQAVYEKYGGHCAYCGIEIEYKQMQVDNIKAKYHGGPCVIENLNPSCRACNNFKLSLDIEEFRHELFQQVERARKYSVNFRNAERFGLIKITGNPVVFYFETQSE